MEKIGNITQQHTYTPHTTQALTRKQQQDSTTALTLHYYHYSKVMLSGHISVDNSHEIKHFINFKVLGSTPCG